MILLALVLEARSLRFDNKRARRAVRRATEESKGLVPSGDLLELNPRPRWATIVGLVWIITTAQLVFFEAFGLIRLLSGEDARMSDSVAAIVGVVFGLVITGLGPVVVRFGVGMMRVSPFNVEAAIQSKRGGE